jgi:serine/threonine protein kinase
MVPSQRYCTRCGAANRAQDAFCFACGHPLQATTTSQQYPTAGSVTTTSTGLLSPNLLLKQRYRILDTVGKGGFGAVYKAEDVQLGNRLLAVKEMSQSSLNPQEIAEAAENFKREALLLAALTHPNLPRIYEQFSEAGRWYLVMDFIGGETLEEYLQKQPEGHLSVKETLQIGIQLCTVLAYLHNRQPPVIFRDLKPSNIMLTPEEHLYLIDFGIARHFKPGQKKDTIAFGSPGYAAPEQYGKGQTTPQSDIFSLGATLHHLLSGNDPSQSPFVFAPLSSATVPAELATLIQRMVKTETNQRPFTVAEVKQELQRIAALPTGSQLPPVINVGEASLPPTQRKASPLLSKLTPTPPGLPVQQVKPSIIPASLTPSAQRRLPPTPNLSSTRTQLSLTRIIFSIVGIVWGTIGCILAIVSLFSVDLLLFPAGLANICIGLMIFFLALMRKSSLLMSTVGIFAGAIAIVSGVAIMIIAAYFPNVIINEVGGGRGSGGLESGTVMLIAGVIILGSAYFRRFEHKNQ